MDEQLALLLIDAVQAPDKWPRVLHHVMAQTGAKAAMITLRDGKTCQIIDDRELEAQFHSPLIRGFSLDAVCHYLQELRTIDPWAAAQQVDYPSRPLLMSSVCAPEACPDQRFFSWLKGHGITDSVVFELERMPSYWTACNFFIDPEVAQARERVLDYAQTHYQLMQKAWQAGQHRQHDRQAGLAGLEHLARIGVAACVTTPSGEVLQANKAFESLLKHGDVALIGPKKRLSFGNSVQLQGSAGWTGRPVGECPAGEATLIASIMPFSPDPLYEGKRDAHWFVALRQPDVLAAAPEGLERLTDQERRLFEAVRAGAKVSEAGAAIGLKRSRTFDVWASAKAKLGIVNAYRAR